jgi:hypothetical protein
MNLVTLSGAVTIALASTIVFLLVVRFWQAIAHSAAISRFPRSIMREAAQRFRDDLERLGREQSVYLTSALVFTVIFSVSYLLPPKGMFDELPQWQLIITLVLCVLAAGYTGYRVVRIIFARRHLAFVLDANMATGHALQKLTVNQNRVFHDVPCQAGIIDNVVVGLHGIYAVSVIARKPGKDNRVRLQGDALTFAPGKESLPVSRSGAKSVQLEREFRKLLGHKVRVRSVIAVPGWEIDSQASDEYLVVNERNLAMLSGWKEQKDYLMNEDVASIQKLLTERCTRFGNNEHK